jgi:hypothetical protein
VVVDRHRIRLVDDNEDVPCSFFPQPNIFQSRLTGTWMVVIVFEVRKEQVVVFGMYLRSLQSVIESNYTFC